MIQGTPIARTHLSSDQNLIRTWNTDDEEEEGELHDSDTFKCIFTLVSFALVINHIFRRLNAAFRTWIEMAWSRYLRRVLHIRPKLWLTNKHAVCILVLSFIYWTLCVLYLEYPGGHENHRLKERGKHGFDAKSEKNAASMSETNSKRAFRSVRPHIPKKQNRRGRSLDGPAILTLKQSKTFEGQRGHEESRSKRGREAQRNAGRNHVIDNGEYDVNRNLPRGQMMKYQRDNFHPVKQERVEKGKFKSDI